MIASGFEGLGLHARAALRLPGLRTVDGLLGAVFTACVGLGIAWIVGAVALQSSGSTPLRKDIQRSAILRELNQLLPPSGPILNALARFDPLPSVRGPAADVPPPTRGILSTAGVRGARSSVVRVIGSACGLGVEGSGWVAAPGLVVTNAHVVAGESDTVVEPGGHAPGLHASVLAFDPHDDIAVLSVHDLGLQPLALERDPKSGTAAAILGYPLDGPFDQEPGRLGQTQRVSTEDAYGNGPVIRDIVSAPRSRPAGQLRRPDGRCRRPRRRDRVRRDHQRQRHGRSGHGGFAVPNALIRQQLAVARSRTAPVSTSNCAS